MYIYKKMNAPAKKPLSKMMKARQNKEIENNLANHIEVGNKIIIKKIFDELLNDEVYTDMINKYMEGKGKEMCGFSHISTHHKLSQSIISNEKMEKYYELYKIYETEQIRAEKIEPIQKIKKENAPNIINNKKEIVPSVVVDEIICEKKLSYLQNKYTLDMFREHSELVKKIPIKDLKVCYNNMLKFVEYKLEQIRDEKPLEATYKYSKNRKDGRMFGINSIQGVNGFVRNFLLDDNEFKDLDIINAHPVFALNICKEHDIACPYLSDYVNNRSKILEDIMEVEDITKGEAKEKVLIMMNSHNKKIPTKYKWLKGFKNEMYEIRENLIKIDDFQYILKYIDEEDANNLEGKFFNHILCIEENKVLQLLIKKCEKMNLKIFSLMFDGLVLYNDENFKKTEDNFFTTRGYDGDDLLNHFSEFIAKNTIHKNIKFSYKKIESPIIMPDDYEAEKKEKKTQYEKIKADFEEKNCKVDINFYCDGNQYSITDFRTKYMNFYADYFQVDKFSSISFIDKWLKDADARTYDKVGIFVDESKCPNNVYNLWENWEILNYAESEEYNLIVDDYEYNKKGLEYFLNHINLLVNYNEELYIFVVIWLAQMFQYTETKTMELIFVSQEGSGKGLFLHFLKTIMGNKKVFETTNPQRDIFGNFNPLMKDSVLVVFNEANKSNFYNANDMKKALITDKTLIINAKGKDSIEVNSNHRFITFTNNADPSSKNKRRDLFIRCSDDKVGDKTYFEEGFKYAEDKNVCLFIYEYLMGLTINKTITQFDIPKSEYDEAITAEQRNIVLLFLEDLCSEYIDIDNTYIERKDNIDIYKDFIRFKNSIHNNYDMSPIAFHMKISFYKFKSITKGNKDNKKFYMINHKELMKELQTKS